MRLRRRFLLLLCTTVIIILVFMKNLRDAGPTEVEGWHPNRSRNIKDYVNEYLKPHILPEDFCAKNETLLVMIMSKPNNFEARSVIRETWAQKRDNVSFFFLLGETKDNFELQAKLEVESQKFEDIIQECFIDHYNNLTLKTVNMLKLFNKYCSKSHKYLMKVDDDVFLNIVHIMKMLLQRTSDTNLLIGKIINDTAPFRDTSSKWYVPYEWYPEEKYPDYLCGPSYLMSADIVRNLYNCSMVTPLFYIEDVYITGICAKKINLVPQEDPRFRCNHVEDDICRHKDLYVLHLYSVKAIREAYGKLMNNGCQSRVHWRDWIFFLNLF